jgi:hypothetical protein
VQWAAGLPPSVWWCLVSHTSRRSKNTNSPSIPSQNYLCCIDVVFYCGVNG